jgi:hypothetical protein
MQYSDTLTPLANDKHKRSHCFKNVMTMLTKQDAKISHYITPLIFKDSITPVAF